MISFPRFSRFTPVLVALGLAHPSALFAQSYVLTESTGTFMSIESTGREVNLRTQDDSSAPVAAPFGFQYFGEWIPAGTTICVNSNVQLAIGALNYEFRNTVIPSPEEPNAIIAPFWDDVKAVTAFWAVTGQPGNQIFAVEWVRIDYWHAMGAMSIQVRIYESDSHIEMEYSSPIQITGGDGSIGIEDKTGTKGLGYPCAPQCRAEEVPHGTLLTYRPIFELDLVASLVGELPASLDPGVPATVQVRVENHGSARSATTSVGLYAGRDAFVDPTGLEIGSAVVPPLAGGASVTVEVPLEIATGSAVGAHQVALAVDPTNMVGEDDDGNNLTQVGTILFGGPLKITTPHDITFSLGAAASFVLRAEGGRTPYSWQIDGTLPAGLSLDGALITGAATSVGQFEVALIVTDARSDTSRSEHVLHVVDRGTSDPKDGMDEEGGCSCRTSRRTIDGWLGLMLLALLGYRARRAHS